MATLSDWFVQPLADMGIVRKPFKFVLFRCSLI